MKRIPIIKYTVYGNNFVIIDEIQTPSLTESEKTKFAYQATNINFGIGSDNFLVIQPCTPAILKEINNSRNYWTNIPDPRNADYIFRMFESDGTEAYSCGNGLMSIANYLFHQYDAISARILTEIPTPTPKVVSIGTDPDEKSNWAKMVQPRRMPKEMADPSIRQYISGEVDLVANIPIDKIRQTDAMQFFANEGSLTVSGYLVFTGEPHFVIFADTGFSTTEIANRLFPSLSKKNKFSNYPEKRTSTGTAFVDFVGKYFAREYSNYFPVGINLNFARSVDDSKILEHRCFERGINHETLACGTGALAVAFVAKELNMVTTNKVVVWPHRCRWDAPNAEIKVEECSDGWLLKGKPCMLFEGTFTWQ